MMNEKVEFYGKGSEYLMKVSEKDGFLNLLNLEGTVERYSKDEVTMLEEVDQEVKKTLNALLGRLQLKFAFHGLRFFEKDSKVYLLTQTENTQEETYTDISGTSFVFFKGHLVELDSLSLTTDEYAKFVNVYSKLYEKNQKKAHAEELENLNRNQEYIENLLKNQKDTSDEGDVKGKLNKIISKNAQIFKRFAKNN